MTFELTLLFLAVLVFAGHAVQTAIGFGAMLLCIVIGGQALSIDQVLLLTLPIAYLQGLYIMVRHHDGVVWPLVLRRVLPLMVVGLALALVVRIWFPGPWLAVVLGVLVLALAVRDLVVLEQAGDATPAPSAPTASSAALVGSGLVQGIYASGGPLLVYALGHQGLTKRQFRSTISMTFVAVNTAILAGFAVAGRYDAQAGWAILWLLPALPLGVLVGEWLHARIAERPFRRAVLVLLVIAALALIIRYGTEMLG